jgi:hypothetical protein
MCQRTCRLRWTDGRGWGSTSSVVTTVRPLTVAPLVPAYMPGPDAFPTRLAWVKVRREVAQSWTSRPRDTQRASLCQPR